MTSKSTNVFQLCGAHWLFAAFFVIAVLTGCKPNFSNLGPCAVCFGPPTQVGLEGTLSGLVGSRLQLQNNGAGGVQLNGAASNGTSVPQHDSFGRRRLVHIDQYSYTSAHGQESAMALRRRPLARPMRLKTTGVSDAQ